jgi:amidohydrolase
MRRVKETAELVAKSGGGEAEVTWGAAGYIATVNNPALTSRMVPSLKRAAGEANVFETKPITASEDFSFFAQKVPSFYFFIGVTPEGTMLTKAAPNHSPRFFIDEAALPTALRALVYVAFDYTQTGK